MMVAPTPVADLRPVGRSRGGAPLRCEGNVHDTRRLQARCQHGAAKFARRAGSSGLARLATDYHEANAWRCQRAVTDVRIMMYQGSCHCGRVSFEVEGDLGQVMECNCSHCSRKGYL